MIRYHEFWEKNKYNVCVYLEVYWFLQKKTLVWNFMLVDFFQNLLVGYFVQHIHRIIHSIENFSSFAFFLSQYLKDSFVNVTQILKPCDLIIQPSFL